MLVEERNKEAERNGRVSLVPHNQKETIPKTILFTNVGCTRATLLPGFLHSPLFSYIGVSKLSCLINLFLREFAKATNKTSKQGALIVVRSTTPGGSPSRYTEEIQKRKERLPCMQLALKEGKVRERAASDSSGSLVKSVNGVHVCG